MGVEKDLAGSVSGDLATVIESEMNNMDGVQPPTLGSVLDSMNRGLVAAFIESGRIEADKDDAIFTEIKDLIEAYGEDALAQRFIRYRTSDNLAVVIQAVMDSHEDDEPSTLGSVLDSMNQGLVASLVGIGEIDPDDDETLFSEIQGLINKHGENTLVEDLLP